MEDCHNYKTQMALSMSTKLLINGVQKEKFCMYETVDDRDNVPNIKRLLKAEEVAELLNISRSFAYLLMHTGYIPTVRLDRACLVWPQDLADYIEKNIQSR
jgi:excisionase family DNA binding protein